MAPASPHLPIFTYDFTAAASHRPIHSSPLSSSPLRPSQTSPLPLSSRDPNALPRRDFNSSPTKPAPQSSEKSKWTKFDTREAKKNPLRQNRESASEGRRKLFLKNVRQRQDDKAWERRGGDQEVLKLEWSALDRRRRQQKDTDIDGLVFEQDLEDIPEYPTAQQPAPDEDDTMVDSHAMEEEAELDAMLSAYEAHSPQQAPLQRLDSPSLSDDEYDNLFMDLLSLPPNRQQSQESGDLALSGQMDLS
ncbi:hypothetical protein TruAng_003936 [Truncatella angustata]|nr:hypothetical protein TruAng_003936 [Truncatella angustata]